MKNKKEFLKFAGRGIAYAFFGIGTLNFAGCTPAPSIDELRLYDHFSWNKTPSFAQDKLEGMVIKSVYIDTCGIVTAFKINEFPGDPNGLNHPFDRLKKTFEKEGDSLVYRGLVQYCIENEKVQIEINPNKKVRKKFHGCDVRNAEIKFLPYNVAKRRKNFRRRSIQTNRF